MRITLQNKECAKFHYNVPFKGKAREWGWQLLVEIGYSLILLLALLGVSKAVFLSAPCP
jgi:hypothetical protein